MNANKALFKLATIISLALYAVTGYGLALTQAEIKTPINQKLDVVIGLMADNKSKLNSLNTSLNYSTENNVSRYKMNYEVIKSDEGNYLKITTNDAIYEPIIVQRLVW